MRLKVKIFLILFFSFFLSYLINKNLFLANSPKINPFFAKNLFNKSKIFLSKLINKQEENNLIRKQEIYNNTDNFKNTDFYKKIEEASKVSINEMKKISSGIYAGEKNGIIVKKIIINELEYTEYTFNIKGKEVKIKVPKGQEPPSQEVVETLYKYGGL